VKLQVPVPDKLLEGRSCAEVAGLAVKFGQNVLTGVAARILHHFVPAVFNVYNCKIRTIK
jgi:hypothetical protein